MQIKVVRREEQANGKLAGGKIEENKPIGFSADRRTIKPFSNIFFFGNSWTDVGASLPEHPHQGFEILTYVINGSWEHFDVEQKKWIKYLAGDAQLIKSGSKFSHAEKLHPNTQIIQIWFDPNLKKSLGTEPQVLMYESNDFYQSEVPGKTVKHLIGEETPIQLDSEDIVLDDYKLAPGLKTFKLRDSHYYCFYILKGEIEVLDKNLVEDDFMIVRGEKEIDIYVIGHSRLLILESPVRPAYETYLELKAKKN